jgi:hypothetical protein
LLLIELAPHEDQKMADRLAYRWPGFSIEALENVQRAAGFTPETSQLIAGPLAVIVQSACRIETTYLRGATPQYVKELT